MQGTKSIAPKRGAEEMEYLLEQQASSGLSVKLFCKEHRMSEAVFYYWQKKLKAVRPSGAMTGGFKELSVMSNNINSGGQLFAEYKGIRFYQEPSVMLLKQLMG